MSEPGPRTTQDRGPARRRPAKRTWVVLATLFALVAAGAALLVVERAGPDGLDRVAAYAEGDERDPLAYGEIPDQELVERATLGNSHVLYARSPEGAIASAERTARWRQRIERAASASEVDPDLMEAVVFLESAGRPDVSAGPTPEAASGLSQILPSTATDLLGMEVDLEQSIRLTRRIGRALERGEEARAERLRERRREVDERFDPDEALAGMVRYLEIGLERLGREDLAVTSYHMGMGNLENVIRAYTGNEGDAIGDVVEDEELSYAQLYFDTSPRDGREAWQILSQLGDDSATYLWRVYASRELMRLWREEPDELARVDELMTAKATAEELFHPPGETERFADADAIARGLSLGELETVPDDPEAFGYTVGPQLGEHAAALGAPREIYAALRPEARATLVYIGTLVREIAGSEEPLVLTSAIRDERYQGRLRGRNPEATDGYSLHTTGYAFDILREYEDNRQARAFQFALDRLSALTVIDYAVEPRAIHITVGPGAVDLLP